MKQSKDFNTNKILLTSFYKEIQVLSKCHHPNIVKFIDGSLDGTLVKEAFSVRNEENQEINEKDAQILNMKDNE